LEAKTVRKVHVVLQDDIDGGEPAQTVYFSLEGKAYEIDLTERNLAALRESMAPWIAAARRSAVGRIPEPRSRPSRASDTVDIRRWARENHIPVKDRGRISSDLRAQYEAAH
jgi:nucleoid-associated protein Lsr2